MRVTWSRKAKPIVIVYILCPLLFECNYEYEYAANLSYVQISKALHNHCLCVVAGYVSY